jgi:hypothetical protein
MSNITAVTTNVDGEKCTPTSPPKEKLRTIMDAASALTSLGDEEGVNEAVKEEEGTPSNHEADAITSGAGEEQQDEKAPEPSTKDDDDDDDEQTPSPKESSDTSSPPKRYLPDHKKPDAAPTFPEKVCPPAVCVLKLLGKYQRTVRLTNQSKTAWPCLDK